MISHVKQQRYLLCVRDSRRCNLHARSRMPWLTLPAGELVEWDVCKGVGPLITQSLHSQAFFKFGLRNDESHTGQPAPQEWGGCCCRAEQSWRRHTHDFPSAIVDRTLYVCLPCCCLCPLLCPGVVLYSLPPIPRSRGLFLLERAAGT